LGKIKVYELAKKMGIKNSEMIEKLNKMGVEVKSHLSTVEDSIANKFTGGKIEKKQNDVKSKKAPKQEQMHIIRRNVRVINTDGDKKEVEQITTNIVGNIKKSHIISNIRFSIHFYPKNPFFFTGGCSLIVLASFVNSSLCSDVSFFGIWTSTVNI